MEQYLATTADLLRGSIDQADSRRTSSRCSSSGLATFTCVEALFDALRAAVAEERSNLETVLEAYRVTLRERTVKTWTSETKPRGITFEVVHPDWPSGRTFAGGAWSSVIGKHYLKVREITESDEAAAWTTELEAINKQARDAAWSQQRDLDRQQEEARLHGITLLLDWAIQHGSERVRLLIEEGMKAWLTIAEDEFFDAHTPRGYTRIAADQVEDSCPAPTAAEIHALRAARETAEIDEALSDVRLARIGTASADPPMHSVTAVDLEITAPHTVVRTVWRSLPDDDGAGGPDDD